jgi:Cu/Ag efflux protein CusF
MKIKAPNGKESFWPRLPTQPGHQAIKFSNGVTLQHDANSKAMAAHLKKVEQGKIKIPGLTVTLTLQDGSVLKGLQNVEKISRLVEKS